MQEILQTVESLFSLNHLVCIWEAFTVLVSEVTGLVFLNWNELE